MKKIFRKIVLLSCVAVLFILPAASAFAATIPVLVIDIPENGVKVYKYEVVEVNDGISTALYDPTTTNQTIFVPADKTFKIQINANNNASLQVTVFGQDLYFNEIVTTTSGAIFVELPANSYDENYKVWVTAHFNDVQLYGFTTTIR
jgi:hypothetical protein